MSTTQMENITECKIGSQGQTPTDIDKIIFNGNEVWSANLPTWDTRGLDYNSWNTIVEYLRAGQLSSVAQTGNAKAIIFDNEVYGAVLRSINDGSGDAGQYYPAKTADFILSKLVDDYGTVRMDNNNLSGKLYTWRNTSLRSWLNSTFYSKLSTDLKNVIISKTHIRDAYNISTMAHSIDSCSDKIWLPTFAEIGGTPINSNYDKLYSGFSSNRIYRQKYRHTVNEYGKYWTSSIQYSSGQVYSDPTFFYVRENGNFDWGVRADESNLCYMYIGFRIG